MGPLLRERVSGRRVEEPPPVGVPLPAAGRAEEPAGFREANGEDIA